MTSNVSDDSSAETNSSDGNDESWVSLTDSCKDVNIAVSYLVYIYQ